MPSNPFNGYVLDGRCLGSLRLGSSAGYYKQCADSRWGASIVDTLDTLLVMGFSDEYNLCRPHVNQLNIHWVNGRDWANGYEGYRTHIEDIETGGEPSLYSTGRDRTINLAVFETGIRYLGGLLGAYDLSGDELLLERALDLGDMMTSAFNTESGLPAGRIDPGSIDFHRLGTVSTAEIGSMILELTRLSQASGNRTFYDLGQRAMDYLETRVIPRSEIHPLLPQWFQPDAALNINMSGSFAFGGLVDSYYEYLIKEYKLLGASASAQQYRRVYEASIDTARKRLFLDVDIVPDTPLMVIAKIEHNRLIPEVEHLTCFAGAMLGLGARLLDRPADMRDAERFTDTCYFLSAATPTGLQPESVEFYSDETGYENVTIDGETMRPHVNFDLLRGVTSGGTVQGVHRDGEGKWRWTADGGLVLPEDGGVESPAGPREYVRRVKGNPIGTKRVNGRGINRPENIESIFYM